MLSFISTLGMVQRQVALRTAVVDRVLDRHASTDFPSCSTEHLHLLFEMAQCFSAQCKTVSITIAASLAMLIFLLAELDCWEGSKRPEEISDYQSLKKSLWTPVYH